MKELPKSSAFSSLKGKQWEFGDPQSGKYVSDFSVSLPQECPSTSLSWWVFDGGKNIKSEEVFWETSDQAAPVPEPEELLDKLMSDNE